VIKVISRKVAGNNKEAREASREKGTMKKMRVILLWNRGLRNKWNII